MYSVVIPAFNSERTIKESIESVLSQSAFELVEEIIVIDDGSKDNTSKIVESIIMEYGNIIKLIKQENRGASFARNIAIKQAKAEWIALLDSDDAWKKNKLAVQTEIIKNNKDIVMLGSQFPLKILFKEYKGLKRLSPKELCIRNMPSPSSIVYRKDIANNLGLYNIEMKYGEDLNFHQKFFKYDSFYIVAEDLVNVGFNKDYIEQSGMSNNIYKMYKARNVNIKELYGLGYISKIFMYFAIIFSFIKHIRKVLICLIKKEYFQNNRRKAKEVVDG